MTGEPTAQPCAMCEVEIHAAPPASPPCTVCEGDRRAGARFAPAAPVLSVVRVPMPRLVQRPLPLAVRVADAGRVKVAAFSSSI